MKYSILLLLTLVIISCSTSKNIKKEAFLYYGKTQCLGKCPVFDMYIFEDGKVIYEGLKNVDLKGKHKFKLSSKEIIKIKNQLNKIDFYSEEQRIRDFPNTILKFNGKKLVTQNIEKLNNLIILLDKIKA